MIFPQLSITFILISIGIYKRQKKFVLDCILYAFPNPSSDDIWYRDRLDLGEKDRLTLS